MYAIVEYAHKIGKNTAEFTASDMSRFMTWWMKQPVRPEVEKAIKQQLKRGMEVHNIIQSNKKEDAIMTKRSNTAKFQSAQKSRLSSDQVVDVDQGDEDIAAAMAEEGMEGIVTEEELDGQEVELAKVNAKIEENEVVCTMELTKMDVEAVLFSIVRTFADYEMEGHEYQTSLLSLKEGLEGV